MGTQKLTHSLSSGIFAVLLLAGFACAEKSAEVIGSKTFLPPYDCDPFHKFFPWKKPCTPEVPTVPVYQPPTPEYKPPTPVYNPTPETPVYNPTPETPVYNPTPETPVYNPTPETPVYNPTPETPVYKPTPETPVYKPTPTPTPECGPKYSFPPIYKHPFFKKKPFFPPTKDEKKN